MTKKIKLILFILLSAVGVSYGQNDIRDGFIITLENDTIAGQVEYRSNFKNYQSCIFKSDRGQTEYYPNQIVGFGYNNDKFYSSQIIEGSFVEVLVVGVASLYRLREKFYVKKDTSISILESATEEVEVDGVMIARENSRWKGILAYTISDCIQNTSVLTSNIDLKEKSLTRIIVKYNLCKGAEFIEFKTSKPWVKSNYGVILGVSRSEIKTSKSFGFFSYLDDSYTSIDPSVGVLIEISSPRISEKVAFQGEIQFFKSDYSSLIELQSPTVLHETFIELTTLSMPLSLKYSFTERKYGLYLQGGINYSYHLSSDTKFISEEVIGNVVSTSEGAAFDVSDNQIGYWGGLGIYKSYEKFKGELSLRFTHMARLHKVELNNFTGLTANINQVSINLVLLKK